jgi:glucokinase
MKHDDQAGFVLGIDFGGTKIALATATTTGERLRYTRIETRAADGAEEVLRRTLDAAHRLGDATPGCLRAAGISTFGVVRDGRVHLAPNVIGWDDLALQGTDVGLYVNLGTGTGAALIVGGRVVPGMHGAAGEIGYLLREPGEPGYAHGHAPLEEYTSGSGLAARGTTLLRRSVTAVDLAAGRDEPAIASLLDDAAATLGMTVANLATFLDPERVVVGGGMANAFLPAIQSAVERAVPFPPPVEAARFLDDAPLIGAIALAVAAL